MIMNLFWAYSLFTQVVSLSNQVLKRRNNLLSLFIAKVRSRLANVLIKISTELTKLLFFHFLVTGKQALIIFFCTFDYIQIS